MSTGYNSTSDIYQWLQGAAPVSTGFAEMLAPLVGAMTGVDVMPVLNMLRFNRQDRPFYEADWSMSRQMRDRFRNMTAGEPSSTNIQMVGRALGAYFLDDKGMAERALNVVAQHTGAGLYAFGTGGLSVADVSGGWNVGAHGRYNDNLVALMADTYNMGFDRNVSKGQRQMLMAGMLRSDRTLLQDYAQARDLAGGRWDFRNGLEGIGELREKLNNTEITDRETEALKKLVDRLDNTRKSLEAFGEAANTWGRVLRTDAQTAMTRMQGLMGGDVYAMFRGNEGALTNLGLAVKHVGGMTGLGDRGMTAAIQEAGKYLMAIGGPAESAVNVATNSMLMSYGMAGYRVTQESAEKQMMRFVAGLTKSDAGSVYFGGYQKFREQQMLRGIRMSSADALRTWDAVMERDGISVRTVNRLLGTDMNISDLTAAAQMNFARDAMASPNASARLMYNQARRERMNNILMVGNVRNANGTQMTFDDVRRMSQMAGMDVVDLANTNETEFMRRSANIANPYARQMARRFRFQLEGAINLARSQHPDVLGEQRGESTNEIMASLSDTQYNRYLALDRQKALRSQISRTIGGKGLFGAITDLMRGNANFTLGDIAVAAGGNDLSYEVLDVLNSATPVDEETRSFMAKRFDALANNENPERKAHFQSRVSEFNKLLQLRGKNGKALYTAEAAWNASGMENITGVRIENGKFKAAEQESNASNIRGEDSAYKEDFDQWKQENKDMKTARQDILARSFKGKKVSDLTYDEKVEYAERMALADMGRAEMKKGKRGNADLANWWMATISGKIDGTNMWRRDDAHYTEFYKQAKEAKAGSVEFEEKKSRYLEELGVSKDQAGTAAMLAGVAKQVVETLISTFSGVGDNSKAINVREVGAAQ